MDDQKHTNLFNELSDSKITYPFYAFIFITKLGQCYDIIRSHQKEKSRI